MFPLDFPLGILRGHAKPDDRVLDPFCGRGTTNFAARLAGLDSLGLDSSPIAVAITASKLVATTIEEILEEAEEALTVEATNVPKENSGIGRSTRKFCSPSADFARVC